jgi:hypothetical protein
MIDLRKIDAIQKIAQRVAALSLVIFIALIVGSYIQLRSMNRRINQKTQELIAKDAAIKTKQDEITALDKKLDELKGSAEVMINKYNRVAEANPKVAEQVAQEEIRANPKIGIVLPLVYIHVKDDSQLAKAKEVSDKLQANGFILPEIQRVTVAPPKTQVRYFHEEDKDSEDVKEIVSLVSGERINVDAIFLKGYPNYKPRRYELWFGADFQPPPRLPGVEQIDKPVRLKPVQ